MNVMQNDRTLGDLCTLVAETIQPSTRPDDVYVGLEHVDGGVFRLKRWSRARQFRSSAFMFDAGDILYGKLRPYLDKAVAVDCAGLCSTELLVLRANRDVPPDFLLGVLHSQPFIDFAQSSADKQYPRTSWSWIKTFPVTLPEPKARIALANTFSEVQAAVEIETERLRVARELKQAALAEVFTNTALSICGARMATIESVAKVLNSSISYSQMLAVEPADDEDAADVMGVKVSDMNLKGNEVEFTSANLQKRIARHAAARGAIPPQSVVFPKRGAAIGTNKKRMTTTWTVLDPNLIAVHAGKDIEPWYLYRWLEQFDLRTIVEPGPTPQLNKKNLLPLRLPVVSLERQRQIAELFAAIDARIARHEARQKLLRELFASLLRDLMTGRRRVTEVAS